MSKMLQESVLCVALAVGLSGCSSDAASGASRKEVVQNYARNLYAAYSDSVSDQEAFQDEVDTFLAAPSESKLKDARDAWLASREHYMLTEGARFYDGPIDAARTPAPYESLINSWPLDEAYIDYTTDKDGVVDETTGLINLPDELPEITTSALDQRNAEGGDENISAGYHAIEFLLWGQALNPSGPGERPATDYVVDGPRANADRRAAYLKVAAEGVRSNLAAVRDAWSVGASYRKEFEQNPDSALTKIFTGLAKFSKGELASERIGAAYTSKERHDQHDCFSSETLLDYERDARGIQAMYLGKYGDQDGPGLDDLVKAVDPELDAEIQRNLQTTIAAIVAIPRPFEDAIAGDDDSEGRAAIRAALDALNVQAQSLADGALALGYTIQVEDPEE